MYKLKRFWAMKNRKLNFKGPVRESDIIKGEKNVSDKHHFLMCVVLAWYFDINLIYIALRFLEKKMILNFVINSKLDSSNTLK